MKLAEIIFREAVKEVLVKMISKKIPVDISDVDMGFVFNKAKKIAKKDPGYKKAKSFDKAHKYLIDTDEADVIAQVNIILGQLGKNPTKMIDHLDGVQLVEQFENTFTVKDFLEIIRLL